MVVAVRTHAARVRSQKIVDHKAIDFCLRYDWFSHLIFRFLRAVMKGDGVPPCSSRTSTQCNQRLIVRVLLLTSLRVL